MIERIKEYLSSEDIEMVTLGARLLEKNIPYRRWASILAECQKMPEPVEERLEIKARTVGYTSDFVYRYERKKWDYDIVKTKSRDVKRRRSIVIKPFDRGAGLWSQLNTTGYKSSYKIITGKGGMSMINKAIESYLHPKKLPNKRAVKIHNKIQYK